jgi:Na+/melibiose symporter-like transporter
MAPSRTALIAVATTILTIIVSVIVSLVASQTSSWSYVILLVMLSIVTLGFGIFQVLGKAYEVREKRTQEQPRPIKITLEMDGEPITIETSDTDRVKEVLKLVQDLQANHSSNVNDGRQH